ncbi:MAG: 3-methyl-2-oxobutanoate hydroxymethyltransferase [Anaerolineales bacterium]|nr:3-methyl-2-oxobutanoate hydroxymethyltransferase [Anaerolineales bacterium]MCB8962480.1 3-methyl-2-oxobutanoate hydroxymethyltransferase [Ardenticatenales bacterium]
MSARPLRERKTSILDIQKMYREGQPFSMVTAYDYALARLVDAAGIEMILVGDSLGMVMMGLESTVPVTMEEMLHHCRSVARGAGNTFLVGDMPFMSYQVSREEAVRNAGRIMKEGGMDAIKLEGGQEVAAAVAAIDAAGIAVMGHIGLTPQSAAKLGGFRVQGKDAGGALRLLEDALALQAAGCFAIVLEAIPEPIAAAITERLSIPTIGIGAGKGCSGQVLVLHDMLGLIDGRTPRFVKQYARLHETIVAALATFRQEVLDEAYPAPEHTYPISEAAVSAFLEELAKADERHADGR